MKNSQTGRTMIEMIGVLAIIGIISIGALAGYTQAVLKYQITKTGDEILALSQSIYKTCKIFGSYEDCFEKDPEDTILDRLQKLGIETPASNPFGGVYAVESTITGFRIQASGITELDGCEQLKIDAGLWPNANAGDCDTMEGGTIDSPIYTLPIDF